MSGRERGELRAQRIPSPVVFRRTAVRQLVAQVERIDDRAFNHQQCVVPCCGRQAEDRGVTRVPAARSMSRQPASSPAPRMWVRGAKALPWAPGSTLVASHRPASIRRALFEPVFNTENLQ